MILRRGKLIVIEGSDGSGKSTQVELLKKALDEKGMELEVFDFPRYEDNIYGDLVKRYLNGEFGEIDKVSPYLASLLFAMDRFLAKGEIEEALKNGKIVLCNRYTASNKAHMGANLPEDKREEFIGWIDEVEYKVNGLPKPDLTIFLNLPPEIGQQNIQGEKDIHEKNLQHLKAANEIYQHLAESEPNWRVVECCENGQIKSPEAIHKDITAIVFTIISRS